MFNVPQLTEPCYSCLTVPLSIFCLQSTIYCHNHPSIAATNYYSVFLYKIPRVDELMGNMKKAVNSYTKAATLLYFLLVEATSLILSPPFSLRSSDRHRLRHYIDILTTRQSQSTAHRMAFLQPEGQQSV
eukprot:Gb_08674 [translate_table: standard]